jgi:hypothetical protein
MQFKSTILIALALSLSACQNSEPALKPVPADQSAQAKIYVQIRELAAKGDLSAASKLTDDPPAYLAQIETARLRMDEAAFLAGMQQAADNPNIEALRVSGNYSMLVTKYDQQGTMQRATTFFRKSKDTHREIVAPDDYIPCKLVRDFYEISGQKDGEVKDCTEDKKPA